VTYIKRTITNDVTSANKNLFDHIQTQYEEGKKDLTTHEANTVLHVTQEFKDNIDSTNRVQDRLLANHEAWFDVDSRATPNSGKYYDLFDDSNTLSIGKIDTTKTTAVGALTAGATIIPVSSVTGLSVGQEITIFDDVALERVVISAITGTDLTVPALVNSYKDKATVCRSSVVVDTVTKAMSFGGWQDITTIDRSTPTTVVASAYDTSGNGGRKLVRLDNGWIVAVLWDNTNKYLRFQADKLDGNGFVQLCYLYNSGRYLDGASITSNGTTVYALFRNSNDTIGTASTAAYAFSIAFDATTITNADQMGSAVFVEGTNQNAIGTTTLDLDSNGHLHASWYSKNGTYPNSFNIRYAKGTIATDGSVTWASPTQVTTSNSTSRHFESPCIIIRSDNNPSIIFKDMNGTNYSININNYDGSSWSTGSYGYGKQIIAYTSYTQSNPSAIVDANGVIHVTWHGRDSTDTNKENIRYSKSTDGGATWSAMEKLTSGNTDNQTQPSITRDKNNKIYVVWLGDYVDATNGNDIKMITNDGSGWSAISVLHGSTTQNFIHPSTCANYFDFTQPLMVFMESGASVLFEGVWQDTDLVEIGVEDVRYNITPSSNIDEAVAWVTKEKTNLTIDGAISIVGDADNESYTAMTKTTTEINATTDEDQLIGSVATANSKATLRLTLNRVDKTVKKNVTKLLGAVN
jgi:hypothetical protein